MAQFKVKKADHAFNCTVEVPGSKSITNRALFLAAMSEGDCELEGVLFSDDSRHFLTSLISLGYTVQVNEVEREVVIHGRGKNIPKKSATIDVGSAGTAARFLTAMLALSDGRYTIEASEQMKRRPMQPLFDALTTLGAQFKYIEKEGFLPVEVVGAACDGKKPGTQVEIDITKSTQFLSALMMASGMLDDGLMIHITSEKTDGSYIHITSKMMEQFGCSVNHHDTEYEIKGSQKYQSATYTVEPDVSAACYFYAAAALTGGKVKVKRVHASSMQGDLKFLSVLEKMGCRIEEDNEGISVTGPEKGTLKGVDVDMNDFSDQSMTLAAIAPFATGVTTIRNIGHIRMQESDRIHAIVTELTRLGIQVEETESSIRITPGNVRPAIIETYEDHRMAMSFALVGLMSDGIVIDNYECCKKTFENYFEVFSKLD